MRIPTPELGRQETMYELMRSVARHAVNLGLSSAYVNRLMRKALVEEASTLDVAKINSNGRGRRSEFSINQSVVAAVTGLSRKEVHNILNNKQHTSITVVTRIENAWRKLERNKPLSKDKFYKLVRKHGRDIPPAAVLKTMLAYKRVFVIGGMVHTCEAKC